MTTDQDCAGLLEALNVKRPELIRENENPGPAGWILSRIDDNGNSFEMQRFLNERSANLVKEKYEKKGHKQYYFVTRIK